MEVDWIRNPLKQSCKSEVAILTSFRIRKCIVKRSFFGMCFQHVQLIVHQDNIILVFYQVKEMCNLYWYMMVRDLSALDFKL